MFSIFSIRMSFSDFAAKNSKDVRFKAIEKMRERETLFNEFMADFKKHEKERLRAREEKVRTVVSFSCRVSVLSLKVSSGLFKSSALSLTF